MTRHYVCLPGDPLTEGAFSLVTVQDEHIESIRQWRNAQINVLRQAEHITPEVQVRYYAQNIWPALTETQPRNVLLAFLEGGRLVGYGGLVHIAWEHRRAEVSFLLDDALAEDHSLYARYFGIYLRMLKELAFGTLGLHRLCTETFAFRSQTIAILEDLGFHQEGRLRDHVRVDGKSMDAVVHGYLHTVPATPRPLRNVLISSAAGKVSLVRCVIDAARRIDSGIRVLAGDLNAQAVSGIAADGFVHLPRPENTNLEQILALCVANGIGTVIPSRDGELAFWAQNAPRLREAGIEVIVSDPVAIAVCVDKVRFSEHGKVAGLPTIPTSTEARGTGPFVVKERHGAGSRFIGINLNSAAAIAHASALTDPVYQPFVAGTEISVDAWIDKTHRVKGLVMRTRDQVVGGESVVTTTFREAALEEQCRLVLESLPLRGPVVLQFMRDAEGRPHIIELNARFGGASTTSIAAGLDVWYWTLLEADGVSTAEHPFYRIPGEVRQVRVAADLHVYGSDF